MADRRDKRDTHDLTRRAFLGGTAAAAATAILAACGSSSNATDTPAPTKAPAAAASPAASGASPAAAGTPKKGGILKMGMQADPVALDPHSTSLTATNHVVELIYGRLVTIDAT